MNIVSFHKKYPDEASCKLVFKLQRDELGVTCRKCGSKNHYWKQDKECYECKKCKFRTTLRSGTVMEGSHLKFQDWFLAMHLVTATKKSFSAKELQRQLGKSCYRTAWVLMHKIRAIMGARDATYQLGGEVELDEGFFVVPAEKEEDTGKKIKNKPGKGSKRQAKVLVMAESYKVDNPKKDRPSRSVQFIKMKVIENLEAVTINKEVRKTIKRETLLTTDGSNSYTDMPYLVEKHEQIVLQSPKDASKVLPWVHIAISNAKRLLLNTYHKTNLEYLQYYLDEYCYKFNRRYNNNLFDRVLVAAVSYRSGIRYETK